MNNYYNNGFKPSDGETLSTRDGSGKGSGKGKDDASGYGVGVNYGGDFLPNDDIGYGLGSGTGCGYGDGSGDGYGCGAINGYDDGPINGSIHVLNEKN